jgi:hypothetical protein
MSGDVIDLRPAEPPTHEALPVRGTLKRVKNGEQLAPPMPWDYPIVAECAPCGKTIRKEESMFAKWEHVE